MLAHHIISAVTVLTVDVGHALDQPSPTPAGATIFTGRINLGQVDFRLDSHILSPSQCPSRILCRLDDALWDEQATVTGYDLAATVALLGALPDAGWSTALRVLGNRGSQPVLDTLQNDPDRGAISFAQATLAFGIPTAAAHPDRDFNAWMTGRTTPLAEQLETDAIACWRLAMARIAARSALGRRIDAAIERHLADWLRRQTGPAAALHLLSLAGTRG